MSDKWKGMIIPDEALITYNAGLQDKLLLVEKDLEKLREAFDQAVQYLKEGKAQFTPHTTNSFVDDFIKKWDKQ